MSPGERRPPSDDSSKDASKTGSRAADSDDGIITRFRTAQSGPWMFAREVLTSVATVALIGFLLFAVSGVWPPMVAVESGSMEPHMFRGDLIFITEPTRFAPDAAHAGTGVVTYEQGEEVGYRSLGDYGSVVIYDNPDKPGPPIIHRARFWVDEGENWYPRADKEYVNADSCAELRNCPAPNSGFITKGDANPQYDQANDISEPVKPEWITGVARVRIPYLGWVRLGFSGAAFSSSPGAIDAGDVPLVIEFENGTAAASEPTNTSRVESVHVRPDGRSAASV
ncbi:S26 family signal peptidase [Halegenticoccus tardaugens]|uniref:S26 family signal peptidase n=1 Tax=Halegenticoccus tardaugens TaxID=2071624 RepID=UPI001E5E9BCE|nr:S26 family signal peptidase [Halegenticoccus tardaugens]